LNFIDFIDNNEAECDATLFMEHLQYIDISFVDKDGRSYAHYMLRSEIYEDEILNEIHEDDILKLNPSFVKFFKMVGDAIGLEKLIYFDQDKYSNEAKEYNWFKFYNNGQDYCNLEYESPLHFALHTQYTTEVLVMNYLYEKGLDLKYEFPTGTTLLHYHLGNISSYIGQRAPSKKFVQFMIDKYPGVLEIKDQKGRTPLDIFKAKRNSYIFFELIDCIDEFASNKDEEVELDTIRFKNDEDYILALLSGNTNMRFVGSANVNLSEKVL
jgi:hypothetical protein